MMREDDDMQCLMIIDDVHHSLLTGFDADIT